MRFDCKEVVTLVVLYSILGPALAVFLWYNLPEDISYNRVAVIAGSFILLILIGLALRLVTTRWNNLFLLGIMWALAFVGISWIMRFLWHMR